MALTAHDTCFGCREAAITAYPVRLQKVRQRGLRRLTECRTIEVPLCAACAAKENGAGERQAQYMLLVLFAPALGLMMVTRDWHGILYGFGLGVLASCAVRALVSNHPICADHPEVKSALSEWSLS